MRIGFEDIDFVSRETNSYFYCVPILFCYASLSFILVVIKQACIQLKI